MGTNYVYIGDNRPDGAMVGAQATTDKIGFWGTTPVVQPTSASQGSVTATATTAMSTTLTLSASNTGAGVFGFSSSSVGKEIVKSVSEQQVDLAALIVLANQMRTELVAIGLIKGS